MLYILSLSEERDRSPIRTAVEAFEPATGGGGAAGHAADVAAPV